MTTKEDCIEFGKRATELLEYAKEKGITVFCLASCEETGFHSNTVIGDAGNISWTIHQACARHPAIAMFIEDAHAVAQADAERIKSN